MNPILNKTIVKDRVPGAELLDGKDGKRIEDTRIMTDEDFLRIKKLK